MFSPERTAVLRAVLNDVCQSISPDDTGTRAHVACKILEAAGRSQSSIDDLKEAGRKALNDAPTMWRSPSDMLRYRQKSLNRFGDSSV
jgi:hypothetical protein